MINSLLQERYYTYNDLLALNDGNQYELHNGKLFLMAGASQFHQEIAGEIFRQLANALFGKPCRAYHPPFDVRLYEDTVYQPDLLVVCDRSKLNGKCCNGAPDFIVEVLSDSTSGIDKTMKFNDYLESGVREYWIVDPKDKTVTAFRLIDKIYEASSYAENDKAPVQVLDGIEIDLSLVFSM
ncbi:MAG: Uma2 family endonuclease [Clostridiales bacterium]|jgi:Uma2 family endonuclease|nr:Uma2 family endonuclease [Clostridiales bacterium]